MGQLVISIAILFAAPWIYSSAQYFQKIWRWIDKLLLVFILALVLGHLLPESYSHLGLVSLLFALAGLFLPSLLERLWTKNAGTIHIIPVILAVVGLCFHGMMDGAALVPQNLHGGHHCHLHDHSGEGGLWLQLAVIAHRLPDALFLWGVFYPRKGARFAMGLLCGLSLATIVGFFLGGEIFALLDHDYSVIFAFQAVVAGSLLHIAFDRHDLHSAGCGQVKKGCAHHHH